MNTSVELMATIIENWEYGGQAHRIGHQESIGTRQVDPISLEQQSQETKRKKPKVKVDNFDMAPIRLGCGFKFDRNALVLVLKISEQLCTRALANPPHENGTTSIPGIPDGSRVAKSGEEPDETLINP